jgi:hypothetical protein
MSADIYADNISRLKEQLNNLQQEKIENYTDIAANITDKYNKAMEGYEEKWKSVQDAGMDDLAGLLGVKGVFKGGKKLYNLYQTRKAKRQAAQEEKSKQQSEDVDEGLDADQIKGPDEIPDVAGGRKMFQDDDDLDANQDWYNDAGEKYFTGTEAEHDNYYNDDGTLKDPSNVPEGHQANSKEDDDDDDFDDDAQQIDNTPQQSTLQNAPDDVADSSRGGADLGEDEFADDPSFLNPSISANPMITSEPAPGPTYGRVFNQTRPTDAQLAEDPFQPTANQSISSSFTPRDRGPMPETGGGEPVIAEPIAEGGDAPGLLDTIGSKASELVGKAGDMVGQAGDLLNNVGNRIFSNLAQRGQNIRQGFQNVKNFFSKSAGDAGEIGADVGGDAAAAGGEASAGILSSLGIGDAVLGAVPVVGEIGLAVGGLVAIGEGIYHLFHHPKAPPAPPPSAPLTAPNVMTQKYSLALPSSDSSQDHSASVGTF